MTATMTISMSMTLAQLGCWQTGSRAAGQPGSQAARQPGSPAAQQPGCISADLPQGRRQGDALQGCESGAHSSGALKRSRRSKAAEKQFDGRASPVGPSKFPPAVGEACTPPGGRALCAVYTRALWNPGLLSWVRAERSRESRARLEAPLLLQALRLHRLA